MIPTQIEKIQNKMVDYPVQKWQTQRGRKNGAENIFRQHLSA